MKTLLTLLVSLSLAAGAVAQQDDAQAKKKHRKQAQQQQQQGDQQAAPPAPHQAPHGQTAPQPHKAHQGQNAQQHNAQHHNAPNTAPDTTTDATGNTAAHNQHHQKPVANDQSDAAATTTTKNATGKNKAANPTTTTTNTAANQPVKTGKGKGQKPDPQVVQQVKQQHVNFKAQPKPEKVPAVTYNQNYRITNSQTWQGTQYEVFRTYHPQWHDQGWYHTHYPRVQIIAGGAYYFNAGFWFPAWGYNPSYQYYAYDAPIYVGQSAEPPDRVIADVQAVLQHEGYYKGEVDGLLGPLTRDALTQYQTDNGLYATATIDEPTLSSLNLG